MLPVCPVLCCWQLRNHRNRSMSVRDGGKWQLKTALSKTILVTLIAYKGHEMQFQSIILCFLNSVHKLLVCLFVFSVKKVQYLQKYNFPYLFSLAVKNHWPLFSFEIHIKVYFYLIFIYNLDSLIFFFIFILSYFQAMTFILCFY